MSPDRSPKLKYQMFERATFSPSYAKLTKPLAWRNTRLEDSEYVKCLHEHPLKFYDSKKDTKDDEDDDGTWRCNGYEIFKNGCKSGQKDFETHTDTLAWRCTEMIPHEELGEEECDFDLCEMCLRWTIFCEKKAHGDVTKAKQLIQEDEEHEFGQSEEEKETPLTRMQLVGAVKAKTNFEWPSKTEFQKISSASGTKL